MKMIMLSASLGLMLAHVPAGAASVDADAISPLATSALSDSQLDTLRGRLMEGNSLPLLIAQFSMLGGPALGSAAGLPRDSARWPQIQGQLEGVSKLFQRRFVDYRTVQ